MGSIDFCKCLLQNHKADKGLCHILFCKSSLIPIRTHYRTALLAVFWVVGLLCGLYAANELQNYSFPLMYAAVVEGVSIVRLLVVICVPFLISVLLVKFSAERLLYFIAVIKAFSYCFTFSFALVAFDSAGWLIKALLLFSDSFSVIFLLWFWVRALQKRTRIGRDAAIGFAALITVCFADYFFVSPFLVSLFNR